MPPAAATAADAPADSSADAPADAPADVPADAPVDASLLARGKRPAAAVADSTAKAARTEPCGARRSALDRGLAEVRAALRANAAAEASRERILLEMAKGWHTAVSTALERWAAASARADKQLELDAARADRRLELEAQALRLDAAKLEHAREEAARRHELEAKRLDMEREARHLCADVQLATVQALQRLSTPTATQRADC